jgi:periplasmic protein CpxP/Spy
MKMKMVTRTFLLGAVMLAPVVVMAQTAPTTTPLSAPPLPPATTQPPAATPVTAAETATAKATDQRIQALKAQLAITAEQVPVWDTFAQTMRDNAVSTDQLFQRRAGAVVAMNAVDNMKSYAEIAQDYATNLARLSASFEALYGGLSDAQKKTADTLFRQQAEASAKPHG